MVHVYARAELADGIVGEEHSLDLAPAEWTFDVNQIPVTAVAASDGVVAGTTAAGAAVDVAVPELGLAGETTADEDGSWALTLEVTDAAAGEYDVLVHADTQWVVPAVTNQFIAPLGVSRRLPTRETGAAVTRLRLVDDAADPLPAQDAVDVEAAAAFLATRYQDGAFDEALRPTAAAASGLAAAGFPVPAGTPGYVDTLAAAAGWAWRRGEPAAASASALASQALRAAGVSAEFDPAAFLHPGGGVTAGAASASVEAAALAVLALAEQGDLDRFDPWWRLRMVRYLEAAEPVAVGEAVARAEALRMLGLDVSLPDDTGIDAVSARIRLDAAPVGSLAAYQRADGGFGWRPDSPTTDAHATGLALRTAAGSGVP